MLTGGSSGRFAERARSDEALLGVGLGKGGSTGPVPREIDRSLLARDFSDEALLGVGDRNANSPLVLFELAVVTVGLLGRGRSAGVRG